MAVRIVIPFWFDVFPTGEDEVQVQSAYLPGGKSVFWGSGRAWSRGHGTLWGQREY